MLMKIVHNVHILRILDLFKCALLKRIQTF